MSIGNLKNEGDLKRWLDANHPQSDGPTAPVALSKEGVPTDEDFPQTPGDRTLAYDRSSGTMYIRDEDEWKPV